MAETNRLSDSTEWIDLGFVERERTLREIIETGIRHHLAGLSLSNTVILLEIWVSIGAERRFITGFKNPIYSQLAVKVRIALLSIRRRSGSIPNSTGCTLLSIRKPTEYSILDCFQRIRFRSVENF